MKKNNKIIILVIALILVIIGLFYLGKTNNDKLDDNLSNPDESEITEEEYTMQLGFGISTYVSPLDAKSVEEGKLQDGELLVNSSFATLLLNNDNRIVYSYIDQIENSIWFNEKGEIGTEKSDDEWLSLKEYDEQYIEQAQKIESDIKGKNMDEVTKYFNELNPEDYPNIELDKCYNGIIDAFMNTKGLSSVRSVGVGIVTRYELNDADEGNNGNIKIISNFGIITTSESETVTSLIGDKIEIEAEIDNKGKVLTSFFDTRSILEKSIDETSEYVIEMNELEQSLLNKNIDDVLELIQDDIMLKDSIYALFKGANSLVNWY